MTSLRSSALRRGVAVAAILGVSLFFASPAALAKAKPKKKTTTVKKKTPTTTRKTTVTTAAPASSPSIPDHPVQGITSTEVKVGFVLGNPTSTTADNKATWNALLASYRDSGQLPANGRDIKPVFLQLNPGNSAADSSASQRSMCVQLATRDKVALALLGSGGTPETATCLAKEYHVPAYLSGGVIPTDDTLAAAWPFLFVNNMSFSASLRNWPYWAKAQGFLASGSKIASFNTDDPALTDDFNKNFKSSLGKLGYRLSAEALYKDASSIPGAVQRFKSSGVDVIFLGAYASLAGFAQELDKQNYHPDVLMTDWDSSAATVSLPRDLPDNFRASAMTYYHRAQDGLSSNPSEPSETTACQSTIAKYSGRRLVPTSAGRPTADYAEYQQNMHMCDMMQVLVEGLRRAPKSLDTASLISAFEQTKDVDHGQVYRITFTPERHDGGHFLGTIIWDYNCDCWKYAGPNKQAYVS